MGNLEEHRKKIEECIEQLSLVEDSLRKAKKVVKTAHDDGVRFLVMGQNRDIKYPPRARVLKTAQELLDEVEKTYSVADEPLRIAKTLLEKALRGEQ